MRACPDCMYKREKHSKVLPQAKFQDVEEGIIIQVMRMVFLANHCWVPGVCDLPGNEGLQMAHAAVPPQAGWWERGCLKVGTHPKSWFWLVKWSNTILYTCIFFTVHLKQDYQGNRSLPCFPRCFLVPNTTTRRWYRLLFSQDLVTKLRETAKA